MGVTDAQPEAARGRVNRNARERILAAAYDLFAHRGIQAVGIDAIIERSGVARQTLYRHFASKQDLVLAFLERREELWTKDWLQSEVERRSADPEKRFSSAAAMSAEVRRIGALKVPLERVGTVMREPGVDFIGPHNSVTGSAAPVDPRLTTHLQLANVDGWRAVRLTTPGLPQACDGR